MSNILCQCGRPMRLGRSSAGQEIPCPGCGAPIKLIGEVHLASGDESLCRLQVDEGPVGARRQYFLSGHKEIEIGKLPEKVVRLEGGLVSRNHCRLVRRDKNWIIEDLSSTNGVYVNGQRVKDHILHDGDVLQIGDYGLTFHAAPAAVAAAGADLANRRSRIQHL